MSEHEYLCPFSDAGCTETRPTHFRMKMHLDAVHRDAVREEDRHAVAEMARPIEDVPLADERPLLTREEVAKLIASNNAGLDRVRREMGDIRQSLAEVDSRMARVDRAAEAVKYTRKNALSEVWDALVDAGHTESAKFVMTMIKGSE